MFGHCIQSNLLLLYNFYECLCWLLRKCLLPLSPQPRLVLSPKKKNKRSIKIKLINQKLSELQGSRVRSWSLTVRTVYWVWFYDQHWEMKSTQLMQKKQTRETLGCTQHSCKQEYQVLGSFSLQSCVACFYRGAYKEVCMQKHQNPCLIVV